MTELVVLLIGSMWAFMMIIAGVLFAFDLIANAFPPAFDNYERGGSPGTNNDRA